METIIFPTALDRQSPLPLWAQLLDDLRRRVEMGEFALPLSFELAKRPSLPAG